MASSLPVRTPLLPVITDTLLALLCLAPFLAPSTLAWNIQLQAVMVTLMGLVAWTALPYSAVLKKLPRVGHILLIGYLVGCGLSLLSGSVVRNIFGETLQHLGIPVLVACVGCGLLLSRLEASRLVRWLYGTCLALALTALPDIFSLMHSARRVSGIFHQPDFLAVFLALGLLLGIGLWQLHPRLRRQIVIAQAVLLLVLLLTQSRAVILLLVILVIGMLCRSRLPWRCRALVSLLIVGSLALASTATQTVLNNRLSDAGFAGQSLHYRVELVAYGLRASSHRPLGYGAGGISTALNCPSLRASRELSLTCRQGYYFTSSHNVFIDRLLAVGWIGGVAFAGFVGWALWRGRGQRQPADIVLWYGALLLAAYCCTNITNLEIELVLWVCLLRPFNLRGK